MQFFSSELTEGLQQARLQTARRKARFRLVVEGREYPLFRLWQDGFAVEAAALGHLRGLVDVHDGGRHILQCLIIASEVQGDQLVCSFKRATSVAERAPLDYERAEGAPIGYLPGA